MTDDQIRQPTLDDVRQRFLDAETHLAGIGSTLERLSGAAAGIGQARQSLDQAGTALGALAATLGETADGLEANAAALRQGVDAIRLGDPAEVRRQLSELDAAFGAFQATVTDGQAAMIDGLKTLEERQSALEEHQSASDRTMSTALGEAHAQAARARLEMRLGLVAVALLAMLGVVLPLVRG